MSKKQRPLTGKQQKRIGKNVRKQTSPLTPPWKRKKIYAKEVDRERRNPTDQSVIRRESREAERLRKRKHARSEAASAGLLALLLPGFGAVKGAKAARAAGRAVGNDVYARKADKNEKGGKKPPRGWSASSPTHLEKKSWWS